MHNQHDIITKLDFTEVILGFRAVSGEREREKPREKIWFYKLYLPDIFEKKRKEKRPSHSDVHCKIRPPSVHHSSQPGLINTTSVHLYLYNLFGSVSNAQRWRWGQILSNAFPPTRYCLMGYVLKVTLNQTIKLNHLQNPNRLWITMRGHPSWFC